MYHTENYSSRLQPKRNTPARLIFEMDNLTESKGNATTGVLLYAEHGIQTGSKETALEVSLFALVFIVLILWVYISNGLTIYLMVTNERFKNPGNYVKCAYAVDDILMNTFASVFHLSVLLSRYRISLPVCRAGSSITIGIGYSSIYFPSFVAVERYFFFCRPFQHARFFTLKSIIGVSCVLILIPMVWSIAIGQHSPRFFSSTALICQLPNPQAWVWPDMVLFLAPAILATTFSIAMIRRLQSRAQARVEPLTSNQHGSQVKDQLGSIKKGIRLLLLISGAFWGVLIPAVVIRVQVISTGITFEQLDNRVDFTKFLLMRLSNILWAFMASALNPVIYFALHRDLRVAAGRLFGLRSQQFSWEKEMTESMNQSNRANNSNE